MRKNQVDVITLGCSKNLVDSEQLIRQFLANGYVVHHNSGAVNGEIAYSTLVASSVMRRRSLSI